MDQVAVGAVDLDDLEAGVERAPGGVRELPDDLADLLRGELCRGDPGRLEGEGAGRDGLPAVGLLRGEGAAAVDPGALGGRLAAGVGELDGRDGAVRREERGDPAEGLGLGVVPQAEVVGEMRPSGLTAVASVMISPVPPAARAARWEKCQSVGTPAAAPSGAALYWHIGGIQTRLGTVNDRRVRSEEGGAHGGLLVGSAGGEETDRG